MGCETGSGENFSKRGLEPIACFVIGGLSGGDSNPAFTGLMVTQAFTLMLKQGILDYLGRRLEEDRRDAEILARSHARYETPALPSASPAKAVTPARRASPGSIDPSMKAFLDRFGGNGP